MVKTAKEKGPRYVTKIFDSEQEDWGSLLSFMLDCDTANVVALGVEGVILEGRMFGVEGSQRAAREFLKKYGASSEAGVEKLRQLLSKETGRTEGRGVAWREVAEMVKDCTAGEAQAFFERGTSPYNGVRVLRELKRLGWKVIVHGNLSKEYWQRLRARYSFLEEGDEVLISSEQGAPKPSDEFFQKLYTMANDECGWFIDTDLKNLEIARAAGWKTILFQ